LPTPQQVIELLGEVFERAGFELDDVIVDPATRPPRIVLVVDGDEPPGLDAVAELSRSASELLDGLDDSDPYVLEVTTPGVERPLTAERHYRRARGRKVELTLSDGEVLTARIGELVDGSVRLVVAGKRLSDLTTRDVALSDVAKAVVQVEFSPPNRRELELAGVSVSDSGESGREADE
jgi:ribosome maturation factor RimP